MLNTRRYVTRAIAIACALLLSSPCAATLGAQAAAARRAPARATADSS
ncbi:MAG: hypothetical protein JJD97_10970, partial [Gemmatimonadaceae bacterium]|nr:hypothetical protein [Gemmatimonadaceae bacterium]